MAFISFGGIMSDRSVTKEGLLRQVDALRDISRRTRRLAETMELDSDRRRLEGHIEQLEQCAKRIEQQAVEAKTFVIGGASLRKPGDAATPRPA
jgi:hypothetical protein